MDGYNEGVFVDREGDAMDQGVEALVEGCHRSVEVLPQLLVPELLVVLLQLDGNLEQPLEEIIGVGHEVAVFLFLLDLLHQLFFGKVGLADLVLGQQGGVEFAEDDVGMLVLHPIGLVGPLDDQVEGE